jgi:hypothetical protein
VASTASASADATARVGMPIFLIVSDIFPRVTYTTNVFTRFETLIMTIYLEPEPDSFYG